MPDLENIQIIENRPDHHYRTEIPNIIFDILDPDSLAIYCHLKRIAGDCGSCWMSMKNLAKKCGVGETLLRRCLNNMSLETQYFGTNINSPLINITKRKKPDGSADTNVIQINDIWRVNGDHFRNKKKIGGSPNEGGVVRQTEEGGSPNEDKEKPSEEKPLEELLCSPEPERPPEIENIPFEVNIPDFKGKTQTIRKDQIFFSATKSKKDWTVNEIEEAWKILVKYEKIADPVELIDGIIKKMRVKKYSNTQIKKIEKEKPQESIKESYGKNISWDEFQKLKGQKNEKS